MTTLVTGATGFVGSAVCRRLLAAGGGVRVLVRPGADRRNIEGLPVDVAEGDLADRPSLEAALRGCRALFHVAADYRLWLRDPRPMLETNVEGTRRLLDAAGQAGIGRIVYTSSVATLGHATDDSPADEDTPVALENMIGPYKRSKFLAESVARDLARKGLPVVIVNPSAPVGPRDIKPTPTGRMILRAASGGMPAFVDTGLNIVDVDDVAAGHLQAFEHGRPGERYVLGGDNMTLRQILETLTGITGRRPPRVRLPHGAVLPAALLMEGWAWVFGGEPLATVDSVRMARRPMYFSSAKASRELGYRARPASEGLQRAVEWFRAAGYCR